MKYFPLAILFILLAGCHGDSDQAKIVKTVIYVDHYKSECIGSFPTLCMRVKDNESEEWHNFYGWISGFNHKWGYSYELKVEIETIENPPEDALSNSYTLLSVVSKNKAPSEAVFDLSVYHSLADPSLEAITFESPGVYKIYNDKEVACSPDDCVTIQSLIDSKFGILFEFSHQDDPSLPLVISQIKCADSRESFVSSCL